MNVWRARHLVSLPVLFACIAREVEDEAVRDIGRPLDGSSARLRQIAEIIVTYITTVQAVLASCEADRIRESEGEQRPRLKAPRPLPC
jgi:hypothetical protein